MKRSTFLGSLVALLFPYRKAAAEDEYEVVNRDIYCNWDSELGWITYEDFIKRHCPHLHEHMQENGPMKILGENGKCIPAEEFWAQFTPEMRAESDTLVRSSRCGKHGGKTAPPYRTPKSKGGLVMRRWSKPGVLSDMGYWEADGTREAMRAAWRREGRL